MNDIEYTLAETNRERSIIKRSAYCKKSGSKSKKCKLPHEYLTRKELEAMNGECRNYQLRKVYSWEEFTKMPAYVQVDYINHYIEKFNVGMTVLATHLFGTCRTSLYMYCKKHNLLGQIKEKKGRPCTKREVEALKEYVAREKDPVCEETSDSEAVVTPVSVPVEPEASNSVTVEEPAVVTPDSVPVKPEASNGVTVEEPAVVTPVPVPVEPKESDAEFTKDEHHSVFRARYDTDTFDLNVLSEINNLFAGRKIDVFISIETKAPEYVHYLYYETHYGSEELDMAPFEILRKLFNGLSVHVNVEVKYQKECE